MTNPQRFINRVLVFLGLALILAAVLHQVIWRAFLHNPALNGLILSALLFGIGYNLRRIMRLKPEAQWIEMFRTNQPGLSIQEPPRLLAPVAASLSTRDRRGRAPLTPVSLRYFLDSISSRLDESRDIARYFTGLLIFLGLLGTFWGLLATMSSVGDVIAGLRLVSNDLEALFNDMKAGLAAPLTGMGTAFSASLFGLAGSLVLGFMDLQASQAQNAFYNDLEEWLSSLTRLGAAEGTGIVELPAGPPLPAYLQAMLQQTTENLERLERAVVRSEEGRNRLDVSLAGLNERLGSLGDHIQGERDLLRRLVDAHEAMAEHVLRPGAPLAPLLDEATRTHIRNTDLQLGRLVEELGRSRDEMTRELRSEIKLVARTIAFAAGEAQIVRD
ncbi:MAG TPA: flagellar motor protein MotA [Geminicoccaceae bacterium]|nr:flagellar motor protein MotA [Geminicoccaceae bacterium]